MARVAILDDYQQVSLASADWSPVRSLAQIDVFAHHIARTEALLSALEPYDVVVAMRERTYFDASRLGQLPRLRLLVTTGMSNPSIDLAAAGDGDSGRAWRSQGRWRRRQCGFGLAGDGCPLSDRRQYRQRSIRRLAAAELSRSLRSLAGRRYRHDVFGRRHPSRR